MTITGSYTDIEVTLGDNYVAVVEMQRPPHNFFDISLINQIADAYSAMDKHPDCRAIVLASQGKNFCAGANFGAGSESAGNAQRSGGGKISGHLYRHAVCIFEAKTPVIAAVQGAAIGGGLGLAVSADFRVTCPEGRFSANFTRLGFHPGFGLTYTLPLLIGHNKAAQLFYTGRRVKGEEAVAIGLADKLATLDTVRSTAIELAEEIAGSAPLAVAATRATLRGDIAERVRAATEHELAEQNRLRLTNDWSEGVTAMAARRAPRFTGT
ncbi:MAG: enoyl-CoA hydratase/isomerase family protein [Gammaproteobacteria bacterium]|nr:enoyl-CoA hydratase/isomerase family protein [Gammaproteobacteria bacterium]